MPFDDDAEADDPGFRPPPHPDDRIWRHPSEVASHPIAPVGRVGGRPVPPQVSTIGSPAPRRRWGAIIAAGAAGAVAAGVGVAVVGVGEQVVDRPVVERVAVPPTASAVGTPRTDTAWAAIAPTVVTVSTAAALGSGVVVRDDGIVVTSAALVPASGSPTVRLDDGRSPGVEVVGTDPATGLAVLDLEGEGYRPSVLAEGDVPTDGTPAVAVSRPAAGVTRGDGTVGPAERYVGPAGTALDGVEVAGDADEAALGGAVVDEHGAVVGITTGIDPGEAWYVVPVAVARRVSHEIVDTGTVEHSWLGIEGTNATAETDGGGGSDTDSGASGAEPEGGGDSGSSGASGSGEPEDSGSSDANGSGANGSGASGSGDGGGDGNADGDGDGVPRTDDPGPGMVVTSVVPGSPAADRGLRPGDRIVALDERPIADMAALLLALRAHAPDDRVDVTVVRADGTRVTLVVQLDAAP